MECSTPEDDELDDASSGVSPVSLGADVADAAEVGLVPRCRMPYIRGISCAAKSKSAVRVDRRHPSSTWIVCAENPNIVSLSGSSSSECVASDSISVSLSTVSGMSLKTGELPLDFWLEFGELTDDCGWSEGTSEAISMTEGKFSRLSLEGAA